MIPDAVTLRHDFIVSDRIAPRRHLDEPRAVTGPAAVAIGVFDGMHVGHQELLRLTVEDARARGVAAVAVTFDPDPDQVLSRTPAKALLSLDDRLRAIAASGVDEVVVVPFNREVAALDHVAFFEQMLFPHVDVRAIHVGSDFKLGAGGASTVAVMSAWCAERGILVTGHDLVADDGSPVTATRIRSLIAAGDIATARRELGRRPLIRGRVHTGRGEGTGMGFPTANIIFDAALAVPADGVYSGFALVDSVVWPAAVNVGIPPMFRDKPGAANLEANLIGFSGDIYGQDISLVFDERLRGPMTFDTTDALIERVLADIGTVRSTYGESGVDIIHDL